MTKTKKPTPAEMVATLTERELAVLKMTCEGKQAKDIAAVWGVHFKTVEKYREAIRWKLEVKTLVEAAVVATKAGIV